MLDKNIPEVEMVRCEVTGKLYPASECEIVVIKIVKSKQADINSYNPFNNSSARQEEKVVVVDNGKPVTDVKVDTSSPEFSKAMHIKRSVIPPAMKDLFQKPPELL